MNLPEVFIQRTRQLLGSEYAAFEQALQIPAPVSVRVNDKITYKPSDEMVAWCNSGYYLPERPLFTADPLFHAGVYYVQEASSMFLQQAIIQHFPDAKKVLDLCAAPGGKSTLISQTLAPDALLVSNEIIRSRAYILSENLIKWGNPNTIATNNEAGDFNSLSGFFDAIVIDAPCSGEGMFRKDEGAISEWSLQNVQICVDRQRKILTDVWNALKTDGILVYSTCTYNREENEENVAWICNELGAELLQLQTSDFPEITTTDGGYRFYPHKTRGEGFFLSVMRKTTSTHGNIKNKKTDKKNSSINNKPPQIPLIHLKEKERWILINENNIIRAYDSALADDYKTLTGRLRILHAGVGLGEIKGKDFIPGEGIALSKILDTDKTPTIETNRETAISYLRKENLFFPEHPNGYHLITHQNMGLGWIKNMGNRCNNLYPQEWRIRMKL